MNRARRYLQSLGTNALLLGFNAVYTLVSVPIALHFLSTKEFGLWIVINQVAGYLSMIDLGTSGAGIRLLVDHKDDPESGAYGGLIKATMLSQLLQAAAILVAGAGLLPVLARWLEIPASFVHTFNTLWLWQIGLLAFTFLTRISLQVLSAHQRLDIVNYSQLAALILNFLITLLCFETSFGVYSLAVGQTVASGITAVWTTAAARRLKYFPRRWGDPGRRHWRELFGYGSEVFLVALGTQFINSSQAFLLTRLLGLEAASVWSVMTKTFTLLTQLVWRIVGVALPAFSEMLVRGEQDRLFHRYKTVFQTSVLASCYCGFLIGLGNSSFVTLWTQGKMRWAPINDWLLAGWFVLLTQVYCHNSLVIATKRLHALKYIYLLEGGAFVAASFIAIPMGGITAMLVCSIICTMVFTFAYGTWRAGELLQGDGGWRFAGNWILPALRFCTFLLPAALILSWLTPGSDYLRIFACVLPVAIFAPVIALRFCVPREVVEELLAHMPHFVRRPAQLIMGKYSI